MWSYGRLHRWCDRTVWAWQSPAQFLQNSFKSLWKMVFIELLYWGRKIILDFFPKIFVPFRAALNLKPKLTTFWHFSEFNSVRKCIKWTCTFILKLCNQNIDLLLNLASRIKIWKWLYLDAMNKKIFQFHKLKGMFSFWNNIIFPQESITYFGLSRSDLNVIYSNF